MCNLIQKISQPNFKDPFPGLIFARKIALTEIILETNTIGMQQQFKIIICTYRETSGNSNVRLEQ